MALSVSNNIKENNISFNSTNLINSGLTWNVDRGSISFGDVIKMGDHSKCTTTLSGIESKQLKCTHLKLLAHLTCDDKTLSTETVHNVSVCYTIEYTSEKGVQTIVDCFYPKYDFEDDYVNDYSIIDVPCSYIKSIKISILNNEDVNIDITSIGLFYCLAVTEETMNTTINNYFDHSVPDIVQDIVTDTFESGGYDLVIPLVEVLPDINSVPDGYICRLASMDAR